MKEKNNRNAVVFDSFFFYLLREKGRSKHRYFRRAFKRQEIRKRRDSANTNVRASFSLCNVNAPANFGPQSIPNYEVVPTREFFAF